MMLDAASNNVVLTITDIRFFYLRADLNGANSTTSSPASVEPLLSNLLIVLSNEKKIDSQCLGHMTRILQRLVTHRRLESLLTLDDRSCIKFF
jgi:hypothetical protein